MIISLNEERPLTNPISIHDNSPGVSRDRRDNFQYNKDITLKTHSQYHSKQGKFQKFPLKPGCPYSCST